MVLNGAANQSKPLGSIIPVILNYCTRLDSVKKLVNLWSSRGLTVYGKVTVIKSLIIPKFVYILSLLTAPKEIVQELNGILLTFLWKGTDKVTRLSTINEYKNGGVNFSGGQNFETAMIQKKNGNI